MEAEARPPQDREALRGGQEGPCLPAARPPGQEEKGAQEAGLWPGALPAHAGPATSHWPTGRGHGGGTPPATPGRRLGSCPRSCKHHTHPHGRPTARLCPGRAWGAKASMEALSGLPRPWAPVLTPRGQGAHSRCLSTRSGLSHLARPCRPHLLQAECPPLPSGQHRRPFKANPTARTPPDHAQSERPRAGPASANRPRSSGNETEANQAQPLCALALTRPHGHVLRGRAPWGQGPALEPRPGEPVPGAGARSRAPARCCLLSPARRPASNLLAASSPT